MGINFFRRPEKRKTDDSYVPVDEAVMILSQPTGDEGHDFLNSAYADLLQRDYIRAYRSEGSLLRFTVTESGRRFYRRQLGFPGG